MRWRRWLCQCDLLRQDRHPHRKQNDRPEVVTPDRRLTVAGENYADSAFFEDGKKFEAISHQGLMSLLEIAAFCNNATASREKGGFGLKERWQTTGEPTEAAIQVLAAKAGVIPQELRWFREREIPFDSDRKMMTVVGGMGSRHRVFTKGAPDILLGRCTRYQDERGVHPLNEGMRSRILKENNRMAQNALRVLGFAYRDASSIQGNLEEDLIFVGLAGMIDPPRPEAKAAVEKCPPGQNPAGDDHRGPHPHRLCHRQGFRHPSGGGFDPHRQRAG